MAEVKNNILIDSMEQTFEQCLQIAKRKTQDYATQQDPFKNFRNSKVVGVKPSRGILVRILDKISRISNLIDKNAAVKDESIEDTINDAINYLAILKAQLQNERKEK